MDDDCNIEVKDIYLGGSCMLRTNWRRDLAIPLLKSRNISFYLPTLHGNLILKETTKRSYTLQEMESGTGVCEHLMFTPRVLDSSRVLLFVITNETRSLAPMTLAAHYIGLAYNVVLCIQMLEEDCEIGGEKVSGLFFFLNFFRAIFGVEIEEKYFFKMTFYKKKLLRYGSSLKKKKLLQLGSFLFVFLKKFTFQNSSIKFIKLKKINISS